MAQDEPKKRKPRGRPFAGRGDPRNRRAGKPPESPPEPAGHAETPHPEPHLPATLLEDMQFVRANPSAADVTPGQKAARKWLAKQPGAFLTKLADVEKARLAAERPEPEEPATWDGTGPCPCCRRGPGPVVPPDAKTPGILELIGKLEAAE